MVFVVDCQTYTASINPVFKREFKPQNKIEIFSNKKLVGTLLISGNSLPGIGIINFRAVDLCFYFEETYGIGMSL
jgi:hypothetical protein